MKYWTDKDPYDDTDFSIDWDNIIPAGDAIASVDWVVPGGLTEGASGFSGTVSYVWLSGGTDGATYTVGGRITTSEGRYFERSGLLRVLER